MIILGILWLIVIFKTILFWTYLWQLKEYHFGRFVDHFRTAKGKALFLDKLRILKLALAISAIFTPLAPFLLVPLIYLIEAGKALSDSFKRKLLKPIFTKKTILVVLVSLFLEITVILALFDFIENRVWLSVFFFPILISGGDLLVPLVIAFLVLVLKPLTYFSAKIALLRAGKKRNQFKKLTVIGITGSYGKSSTKEFLFNLLSEKFRVLKTEKNINAEIGIAKTILNNLKPEHQILIAEIGAYNLGKIREVCRVIRPDIGILTGINEQHLATFGSLENIFKAKHEIFECLSENGLKIERDRLSLKAEDIIEGKEEVLFKINGVGFRVNILGKHNLDNLLLAIECASKLGMSLEEISKACLKIKNGKIIKRNPVIIDNSYSANPTGVIFDVEYLKLYGGRRAVVMPCLIELGKASRDIHRKIGKKLKEVADLAIITTKDQFDVIQEEFPELIYSENPDEILEKLKDFEVILIEGRVSKNILEKIRCI